MAAPISTDEQQLIEQRFSSLLNSCNKIHPLTKEEEENIYRAFSIARRAHEGQRRKSGEAYIFHPLSVARIAVEEVGLGHTAVICALLHDVVEDTDIDLDQIRVIFGDRVARIVDGVTKINTVTRLTENRLQPDNLSKQAENYRKILLAMCDDVYVIFIKLCDRLHNMRTIDSMKDTKRLAIASETQYLYIPLAHRLGLYNIKTELEELVMRQTNPKEYYDIQARIQQIAADATQLEECFIAPIQALLDKNEYKYTIKSRTKSVFSCWKKMQNKSVEFDEIYDLFAMRIILDVPTESEKAECFKVYALILSLFPPNPSRFRDWITTPKNNGYESLHTTVMSPLGRWVEVQIRSQRMDEVAEKGMAAHFLYKEAHPDEQIEGNPVEEWLQQIRISLENSEKSALDLVEEFKQTLYTREIYLFTPKGENIILPARTTVLDLAFAMHSELGDHCIGAKVNAKVVPVSYVLHSGEQVQVLTSHTSHPTEDWLKTAKTTHARERIKEYLKNQKKGLRAEGNARCKALLHELQISDSPELRQKLQNYFEADNETDLLYRFATGAIGRQELGQFLGNRMIRPKYLLLEPYREYFENTQADTLQPIHAVSPFLLDPKSGTLQARPASCCKPIQGDEVVGITVDNHIEVHRTSCPIALHEMSTHEERIVRARWRNDEHVSFLTGVAITAIDRKGMLQDITQVITHVMELNIRAVTFEATEGVGRGIIMLYLYNLQTLSQLIKHLMEIDGVESVKRI